MKVPKFLLAAAVLFGLVLNHSVPPDQTLTEISVITDDTVEITDFNTETWTTVFEDEDVTIPVGAIVDVWATAKVNHPSSNDPAIEVVPRIRVFDQSETPLLDSLWTSYGNLEFPQHYQSPTVRLMWENAYTEPVTIRYQIRARSTGSAIGKDLVIDQPNPLKGVMYIHIQE